MRSTRFFFGLLLAAATLRAEETPPVWQTDWNTAFKIAKEQNRLVFVDYGGTSCKPCEDMETTVFRQPDVLQRLSEFVLLRVDVDRGEIPQSRRVLAATYIVFDPAQRERFRFSGEELPSVSSGETGMTRPLRFRWLVNDWHEPVSAQNKYGYPFLQPLDRIRLAAPAFLQAAGLFDTKHDLEASFLVAKTYGRLKMTEHARAAYAEAQKIAEGRGDKAVAQVAEVQSAFTFVHEGDPSRAIKALQAVAEKPVNRDNEATIWLALGRAYEVARETKSALKSYLRAQSLAARDSRTYAEASESIARLK